MVDHIALTIWKKIGPNAQDVMKEAESGDSRWLTS